METRADRFVLPAVGKTKIRRWKEMGRDKTRRAGLSGGHGEVEDNPGGVYDRETARMKTS